MGLTPFILLLVLITHKDVIGKLFYVCFHFNNSQLRSTSAVHVYLWRLDTSYEILKNDDCVAYQIDKSINLAAVGLEFSWPIIKNSGCGCMFHMKVLYVLAAADS